MSAKKQSNRWETVHNAATGYTVVVLAIVCLLLVLAVLMAGVRALDVFRPTPTATVTTTTSTSDSGTA